MPTEEDAALIAAVLGGDRGSLTKLVAREHPCLVRLARSVVRDAASADEVVQDAWISIIRALPTFEGRSSLRTWMATIVLNRAKTTAVRNARMVPVATLDDDPAEACDAVDGARFGSLGFWSQPPTAWPGCSPEASAERRQLLDAIEGGLQELPPNQRAVLTLRDIEGWSSEDACNALGLSESNQRVLLHRARARLRTIVERTLGEPAR